MTESTGWTSQPDPAEATPDQAPPAPHAFTAEELAEAARQIQAQHAGVQPAAPDSAELGMQALAAGAEAADVDTNAMLASIRALQSRITALEAEKRAATAPDVVKYAQAILDHLSSKSAQHPAIQGDLDHTYGAAGNPDGSGGRGVLGAASHLVATATSAADSGQPGTFSKELAGIETWVKRHARRFPTVDYGYVLELAEEAGLALAKLAA